MNRVHAVFRSLRLPFLLLSVASIALGAATAFAQHIDLTPSRLIGVVLAAFSAHASVNLLNEYQDFQSGIDLHTERTAFSGGSGGLPANPQFAKTVLFAGIGALDERAKAAGVFVRSGVSTCPALTSAVAIEKGLGGGPFASLIWNAYFATSPAAARP